MKKQVLFTILMLLPLVAMADDSGTCGENLIWTYSESTKTLTISGTGNMTDYSSSNPPWYSYRENIVKVIIEEGVTSIGICAFHDCFGLTNVSIPNSVTSIGEGAFIYTGIYSVTIPNSVKSIENSAFCGCWNLTSITIPNSVTIIGNSAFNSSALTSIEIPNSVISIGNHAFAHCYSLTSIIIPNSVTSIDRDAFEECSGLQKVIVSDIAAWCGIKFYNYYANPLYCAKHLYSDENTEITDLIIPNNVTSIGDYVFIGCSKLTYINIPNSVTSIGRQAFYGSKRLSRIDVLASKPPYIEYEEKNYPTFGEIVNDQNETYQYAYVHIPKGTYEAYSSAYGWKKFKNIKTIDAIETVPQDINGDGIVDTQDVLEIYKYIQEH